MGANIVIIAVRFMSKKTWHLREVNNNFPKEKIVQFSMGHSNFWPPIFNPCGIKVVPNYPVDRKIHIARKDFHLLNKNGLCKRCTKRLKDYAKFKFLHERWMPHLSLTVLWVRNVYDTRHESFNTNFYNNLYYLQKIQENNS